MKSASFQPFLRFYVEVRRGVYGALDGVVVSTLLEILLQTSRADRRHSGPCGLVSTLLEILPLMLGGFPGF